MGLGSWDQLWKIALSDLGVERIFCSTAIHAIILRNQMKSLQLSNKEITVDFKLEDAAVI